MVSKKLLKEKGFLRDKTDSYTWHNRTWGVTLNFKNRDYFTVDGYLKLDTNNLPKYLRLCKTMFSRLVQICETALTDGWRVVKLSDKVMYIDLNFRSDKVDNLVIMNKKPCPPRVYKDISLDYFIDILMDVYERDILDRGENIGKDWLMYRIPHAHPILVNTQGGVLKVLDYNVSSRPVDMVAIDLDKLVSSYESN